MTGASRSDLRAPFLVREMSRRRRCCSCPVNTRKERREGQDLVAKVGKLCRDDLSQPIVRLAILYDRAKVSGANETPLTSVMLLQAVLKDQPISVQKPFGPCLR